MSFEIGYEVPQVRLDRREALLNANLDGGWHSESGEARMKRELAHIAFENLQRVLVDQKEEAA